MPLSSDPAARERQLANLRSTNAQKHGAHSEATVRPLRKRFVAELAEEFPSASERELRLIAHRLAQLELLAAFTDERGVIRHRRRGDVYPAATLAEQLASAVERRLDALRERERAAGRHRPGGALEAHLATLTAGEGENGGEAA